MQKSLRFMVLTGILAVTLSPAFASGPGDGDPPPPTTPGPSATASATPAGTVLAIILQYLGI